MNLHIAISCVWFDGSQMLVEIRQDERVPHVQAIITETLEKDDELQRFVDCPAHKCLSAVFACLFSGEGTAKEKLSNNLQAGRLSLNSVDYTLDTFMFSEFQKYNLCILCQGKMNNQRRFRPLFDRKTC